MTAPPIPCRGYTSFREHDPLTYRAPGVERLSAAARAHILMPHGQDPPPCKYHGLGSAGYWLGLGLRLGFGLGLTVRLKGLGEN